MERCEMLGNRNRYDRTQGTWNPAQGGLDENPTVDRQPLIETV